MTLHIARRIWAMQKKKQREKYSCPEAWEKRKREKKKKDSPYLKIKDKSHAERGASSMQKNSTHMHILI